MNMQTIDVVKDAQVQAVETQTGPRRRDAAEQTDTALKTADSGDSDKQKQAQAPSQKDVAAIAKQAGDYFQAQGVNLHFKVVEGSRDVQVEMLEPDTHKVIRKIPQDDIVKLQKNMKRLAKGVMDVSV